MKTDKQNYQALATAVISKAVEDRDAAFFQSEMFTFWCGLVGANSHVLRKTFLRAIEHTNESRQTDAKTLLREIYDTYNPSVKWLAEALQINERTAARILSPSYREVKSQCRITLRIQKLAEDIRMGYVVIPRRENDGKRCQVKAA